MSYDNILYAMLNLFTVISTEGWTDLMYQSQDSVSDFGAGIFYCFCIYLMTYIMVPMFIGKLYHFEKKMKGNILIQMPAVITSSFSRVRGSMRQSAFATGKRTRLLLTRQMGDLEPSTEDWIYEGQLSANEGSAMREKSHRIRKFAATVVSHRYFPIAGSILVALNIALLAVFSSAIPWHRNEIFRK